MPVLCGTASPVPGRWEMLGKYLMAERTLPTLSSQQPWEISLRDAQKWSLSGADDILRVTQHKGLPPGLVPSSGEWEVRVPSLHLSGTAGAARAGGGAQPCAGVNTRPPLCSPLRRGRCCCPHSTEEALEAQEGRPACAGTQNLTSEWLE